MKSRIWKSLPAVIVAVFGVLFGVESVAMSDAMNQCLLGRMETADAGTTIGELNSACKQEIEAVSIIPDSEGGEKKESVVEIRRRADYDARDREFVISTYRPNYILYTYNSDPNEDPYRFISELLGDESLDESEMKFQVSFKMPVATSLFGTNTDLLFAYTSVSWWQFFNDDISAPFRETNYEPEIFFRNHSEANILGLQFIGWDFGFNHQSNGRSEPLSRSWNRIIGGTAIEITDSLVLGLRAWYRIPEDSEDDDNPHMRKYYGIGDMRLGWAPNRNTFTLMFRPGTEENALEFTWSYPLSNYLRVYAQYWNGYGESLLDYNVRTHRVGLGIALSDFLSRR